jgi:hypothetical protein
MNYSTRAKAWLVVGYLMLIGASWAIAEWQDWESLTSGVRPLCIVIPGLAYWAVVGVVWFLRTTFGPPETPAIQSEIEPSGPVALAESQPQ